MDDNKECQIHGIELIFRRDPLWKLIDKLGIRRNRALNRFARGKDITIDTSNIPEVLNLKPGDLVQVRTEEEILATLNVAKYKGLSFMPEMLKFCGKQFRVLKRVNKYIVEGKNVQCIHPKNTVILEGVFCDGTWHGGCDRTCFGLWREKWLKKRE